jgi:hypothetical protein
LKCQQGERKKNPTIDALILHSFIKKKGDLSIISSVSGTASNGSEICADTILDLKEVSLQPRNPNKPVKPP